MMNFLIDFLVYDGKVALTLLVFYLFYRFFLKKETFHRFNRVVLVGIAMLSFLLPLCIITIHRPAEPGVLVMEMTEEMRELAPVVSVEDTFSSWPVLLAIVLFWAGAAFVLVRVIVSILSISKIVRQGELAREEGGCKIIVTDRDIDPFSWMRYIVLSRKDWEGPHDTIIAHEKAHIGYGHSVELLLVDLLSVLQWFNPAIWMLRSDLRELHEYEADDAVLRAGTDIREYQYLLIRKAAGKSGYSVANSFNHSILKNRITMMSKSKTPPSRRLRVLWALPLVCLAIGLQARTIYVPAGEDTPQEGVQVSPQTVIVLKVAQDGRITVDGREIPQNELAEFLRSQGTPVSSLVVEVDADENTPKEILVKFYDGLRNAGVMKVQVKAVLVKPEEGDRFLFIRREAWGEEKEMSMEEAWEIEPSRVRSIDVLEYADAKEKYGEKAINGVRIFNMKRPQELDEIVVVSYAEEDDGPIPFILADPDTLPRFQGEGMDAFSRWLNVRIRRPKGCTHAGDMKVSFTVATDGSVQDIKVTKSVCESLDAMVVSLIGQSPKWEPATAGGHPVAQCLTIPITFKMR